MAKVNTEDIALAFGRSTAELRNCLRHHIQEKIKEQGINITFELLDIMFLLWRKDGANQQELADIIIKDKSSMTYLIDNLVKRRLVKRVADINDRRSKLIFLTEKGIQLREKIYPWIKLMYKKATVDIDVAELERAISLVKKMNDNLKL